MNVLQELDRLKQYVENVNLIRLKENDTLVVKCRYDTTTQQLHAVHNYFNKQLNAEENNIDIVVVDCVEELAIVRK